MPAARGTASRPASTGRTTTSTSDHFQKLRMRNWPACPNYETTTGPVCATIRRWGFPYSPLHPVFTPSRIHMDQTYRFYAGLPYFFKESRFDVVQDVDIEAMRDDEWVFSGYSFTDTLWFDAQGKLHQGDPPQGAGRKPVGRRFFQPHEPRRVRRLVARARGRGNRNRARRRADAALRRSRPALEPLPGAAHPAEGRHDHPPAQRLLLRRLRRH